MVGIVVMSSFSCFELPLTSENLIWLKKRNIKLHSASFLMNDDHVMAEIFLNPVLDTSKIESISVNGHIVKFNGFCRIYCKTLQEFKKIRHDVDI